MTKHPILFWACGFVIGILFGIQIEWFYFPVLVGLIVFTIGPLLKHQKRLMALLWGVSFFFFLIGGFLLGNRTNHIYSISQIIENQSEILTTGEVYRVEYKNDSTVYYLKNCKCVCTKSNQIFSLKRIMIYANEDTYSHGQTLLIKGDVYHFQEARNYGNFDAKKYYQSIGIFLALHADDIELISEKNMPSVRNWVFNLSNAFQRVIQNNLTDDAAGVLQAMLLGNKTELDLTIKELYQRAGISHVLAVSGLHISLVGMGLYKMLRKIRISIWMSSLLSGIWMLFFLLLTGESLSAKRAVGMFVFLLLARCIGRSDDSLTSLGICAIMILLSNPFYVYYTGFQLSFGAIVGIEVATLLYPFRLPDKKNDGMLRTCGVKLKNSLFMSLGIFLVTGPILANSYYSIASYSILLNMLVLPFMTPLVMCGLLGTFAGALFPNAVFLTSCLYFPCKVILTIVDMLCNLSLKLPGAELVVGRLGTGKTICYYLLLLFLLFINRCACNYERVDSGKLEWRIRGLGMLLPLFLAAHFDFGFHINVLDVGQGDGTLIHTRNQKVIFVDGGSSDISAVGSNRILPFLKASGYGSVDYWIISHADEDHYSGLIEVLNQHYPVKVLLMSESTFLDDKMCELISLANENGTQIVVVSQNDILELGDTSLTFFESAGNLELDDINDRSLCFYIKAGEFTGLFCGDISAEVERALLNDSGIQRLLESGVTYYKCNHHGSKYSSCEEWLMFLHPEITSISCGVNNHYGHPAQETLSTVQKSGSMIYLTMDCGEVTIYTRKKKLFVSAFFEKEY